ncbi:50S ribosomal protein L19 [Phanerochaete sordida]|uniref:50S ribosomal protein L19 n=1 Tax=Phanerochaete sordida TaxID=48140 RepID=A0A9P3FWY2_9APHY|nr:50S ribosomal protein L19 [Phanerochaete sordida]
MALNPLRRWARSLATAAYPFSKAAIIPSTPPLPPTPALLKGKGLMPFLKQSILPPEKQNLLDTLFAKRHPDRIQPGSVLTVTLNHAPGIFSGVLLGVRRRGLDTSFRLRNVINRTGVEMQFFISSPHVKEIKVLSRAGGSTGGGGRASRRMRRAKLFYLRDSPDKMSAISQSVKG